MKKQILFFSKVFFMTIFVLSIADISKAQSNSVFLNLENLILYKVYQKDSVFTKLGQPDHYKSHTSEFGLNEEYEYGINVIMFSENGKFSGFALLDSRFAIFSSLIPGGIRVGDSVSKFQQLSFGNLEAQDESTYAFMDNPKNASPLIVHHSNGIITKLLLF